MLYPLFYPKVGYPEKKISFDPAPTFPDPARVLLSKHPYEKNDNEMDFYGTDSRYDLFFLQEREKRCIRM